MTEQRKSISIGIPCYSNLPSYQTLEDYMRFAFHLGRRYQEYDFFLAVRGKKEQFRARNAIVEESLRVAADYLFMLDDDQIIDIESSMLPSSRYEFLRVLINHLEEDPLKGIVGALYYQRSDTEHWPVIMQSDGKGAYFFLTHMEVARHLQRVDVTGGGAMLIRMEVFDRIASPWFEPEFELGTDVQICKKVAEAGYTIWCDTSIEIGHTRSEREIVTSKSIRKLASQNSQIMNIDDRAAMESMLSQASHDQFMNAINKGR